MIHRHRPALPALGLAVALLAPLGACSNSGTVYPSLSIGDRGVLSGTMQPVPPAEAPVPETANRPAGTKSVSELLADAHAAHSAFMTAAEEASAPVRAARGAGRTSDAWATAQIALAVLEASRSQTMIALADLDRRYVDAELETGSDPELAGTRQEVEELAASQSRLIDSLFAELR